MLHQIMIQIMNIESDNEYCVRCYIHPFYHLNQTNVENIGIFSRCLALLGYVLSLLILRTNYYYISFISYEYFYSFKVIFILPSHLVVKKKLFLYYNLKKQK